MSNKAREIVIPKKKNIFRIIFLYVGQGDATLLAIPEKGGYKYVLIDSNYHESAGGIDLIKLLTDLFKDQKEKLSIFINTHPHKDHLGKVKEIYKKIGFDELWHSGHKPGKDHDDEYKELEFVIEKLGLDKVRLLKGSREDNKIDEEVIELGDINFNILAPAEHVVEDIKDEKPEDRYQRIHEQCGVIRFKYGKKEKQILICGDADYKAWKEHITKEAMLFLVEIFQDSPEFSSSTVPLFSTILN